MNRIGLLVGIVTRAVVRGWIMRVAPFYSLVTFSGLNLGHFLNYLLKIFEYNNGHNSQWWTLLILAMIMLF